MRRTYADLHLCANVNDSLQHEKLVHKASSLGYRLVSIPLAHASVEEDLKGVKRACYDANLDFASRVDLAPRSPEELLRWLRKVRRRFEIVAVVCHSKGVARQAAKDRRVDLLNFPQPDFRRAIFDDAEAELASTGLSSFEIDVKPLLCSEGQTRMRLLAILQGEVKIARAHEVPIVVSSGVSEGLLMRRPTELAAVGTLFGLHGEAACKTVSDNPVAIVKRNREKLDWRFVAPGIRVIRRGKDC